MWLKSPRVHWVKLMRLGEIFSRLWTTAIHDDYHGCWCHGDAWSHDIRERIIFLSFVEYSGITTRRVGYCLEKYFGRWIFKVTENPIHYIWVVKVQGVTYRLSFALRGMGSYRLRALWYRLMRKSNLISTAPLSVTDAIKRLYVPLITYMSRYLTHWDRDQIDAISQTTFSNAFSRMKMNEFRLGFHWSLFLVFKLTKLHHWFR